MPAMLAILGGTLALVLGLAILLLPLLANELSRQGDSGWGAVILVLGLVLVTSSERLAGAPMLAVLSGGLLIGRLGSEVGQSRWRQLTTEERQRLWSSERWRSSLAQLGASLGRLGEGVAAAAAGLGAWIAARRQPKVTTKRWVRPEGPVLQPEPAPHPEPIAQEPMAQESMAQGEHGPAAEPAVVAEAQAGTASPADTSAEPTTEPHPDTSAGHTADPTVEPSAEPSAEPSGAPLAEVPILAAAPDPAQEPLVVSGFEEIDALLREAGNGEAG